MRDHHEYEKKFIGESDYATLITFSPFGGARELKFDEDGAYRAYIVDGEAKIPQHYRCVSIGAKYMKFYDDTGLAYVAEGDTIKVFRAQKLGCIIQIEKDI